MSDGDAPVGRPGGSAAAPRVLVTRAEPGAGETAATLRARGYRALVSPALSLEPVVPAPPLPEDGLQGLVFTSANGVRALVGADAPLAGRRDLMCWCVGPATLAAAEAAGFTRAASADGDADDLLALIVATADRGGGGLLHVANTAAAGHLVQRLSEAGFDARFAGLYAPVPAPALTADAAAGFAAGEIAGVLFHSARGASGFAALAGGLDLAGTTAIAVSAKAFAPAEGLSWKAAVIAERPNEDALLAALATAISAV
ncbi:MAG: uroporphyrinogen-III synthase [Pseudomonadota bacterium]